MNIKKYQMSLKNTVHSTVFSVVGLKRKLKILMSNVFLKNCVLTITSLKCNLAIS